MTEDRDKKYKTTEGRRPDSSVPDSEPQDTDDSGSNTPGRGDFGTPSDPPTGGGSGGGLGGGNTTMSDT